jgi:hypothetical protein
VATTALLWYLGIVHFDSDFAFTVTNVFIHGIPYLALVYTYQRAHGRATSIANRLLALGPLAMVVIVWLVAFGEEALWDRTLWHERAWLFGGGALDSVEGLLVPLLAVPQIAHYLLDCSSGNGEARRRFSACRTDNPVCPPRVRTTEDRQDCLSYTISRSGT